MEHLVKIKQLLERNEYQVIANIIRGGCTIEYPSNLEEPTILTKWTFSNNGKLSFEKIENGLIKYYQDTKLPNYCIKSIITLDTTLRCLKLQYHPCLIRYVYKDEEINGDTWFDKLPIKLTKEEKARDIKLQDTIQWAIFGEEPDIDDDIKEGFEFVKNWRSNNE